MKIIFTLFMIMLPMFSFSQISYGFKGGVNTFSTTSNGNFMGNFSEFSTKVGYQVGIVTEIKLAKKVFFQPELIFILNRYNSNVMGDNYTFLGGQSNKIELPLLVKFKLKGKKIGVSFLTGFISRYTINSFSKWEKEENGMKSLEIREFDYKLRKTRRMMFGPSLGISPYFIVKGKEIYIDFRYFANLIDTTPTSRINSLFSPKLFPNSTFFKEIQLSLGCLF